MPELDDIAAADPAFAELLRAERSKAEEGPSPNVDEREPITVTDFFAYMPAHKYIFVPTRELWPDRSVNGRLPPMQAPDGKTISAATWLDKNRPIEQMIWAPGEPLTISGKLLDNGGWIERPEVTVFNLYRPPIIVPGGVPDKAERWVAHIKYVYPDDAEHIINWFAHRVQRPQEKLNHALVLGGKPGIGKDTLIEPVKRAIGPWNFQETQPTQIVGRFNGFLKSVILRISEASDTGGEFDRFQLYEHTKIFIAAPPDVLRIDEKNIREHSIVNVVGIVYTTNHKSDGIYLPADDRRHYVAWSDRSMDDERFQDDYWNQLWKWYDNGGFKDIAAFLRQRDLSQFDPKAPPPKTPAFWAIVDANRAPEEAELTDLIEQLGNPAALPLGRLQNQAEGEFKEWINDRRNRRVIPHRLEKCGYVPVRNPDAKDDGLWRISGKRQAVYAKTSLTLREQIDAARSMRSFKAPALNGVWAAVDVLGGSCRAARMPGVNYMSVQHWIANRRRPRPRYVAHLRKLILQLAGELTLIAQRLQAEYTQAERRRQGRLAAFYRRMGEGHGYQGWQGSSPLTEGTTAATVTVMSVMSVKIHRHIFLPSFRT